jgi:hypothetical protein
MIARRALRPVVDGWAQPRFAFSVSDCYRMAETERLGERKRVKAPALPGQVEAAGKEDLPHQRSICWKCDNSLKSPNRIEIQREHPT